MKKHLWAFGFFSAPLLASGTAIALPTPPNPPAPAVEIASIGTKETHRFLLTLGASPTLVLREPGRADQMRALPKNEIELLRKEATRLAWNAQYRKPASAGKSCRRYASVKSESETAVICMEHRSLVGRTYGLLNQMRSYFR